MSALLFLTAEEMNELTGRRRRASQESALRAMGIEHKVRADGRVLVLRKHVEQVLGAVLPKDDPEKITPNWDAA